ncbi:hypothetical protein VTK56DRAFT_3451 [Thermocarpiscus australiensis]
MMRCDFGVFYVGQPYVLKDPWLTLRIKGFIYPPQEKVHVVYRVQALNRSENLQGMPDQSKSRTCSLSVAMGVGLVSRPEGRTGLRLPSRLSSRMGVVEPMPHDQIAFRSSLRIQTETSQSPSNLAGFFPSQLCEPGAAQHQHVAARDHRAIAISLI